MSANSSDILAAINPGLALNPFAFVPVFDGPGGILSDYPAKRLLRGAGARVPVLAGTNLDEGRFLLCWSVALFMPAQGRSSLRGASRLKIFLYG